VQYSGPRVRSLVIDVHARSEFEVCKMQCAALLLKHAMKSQVPPTSAKLISCQSMTSSHPARPYAHGMILGDHGAYSDGS
jgi:hypothetical protein